MHLIVIGSGGRLGRAFVRHFGSRFTVTALDRKDLDLGDEAAIRRVLGPLDYDRVLLPGALTLVDYCEDHRDEAFAVNATGPGLIARISAEKNAHVTYFSTDFVFDGDRDVPYDETCDPNPLSVYGESKLRGEEAVLAASSGNLVVRVSWLYGAEKPAFPEWIIQQALKQSDLTLPGEKIGNTTRAEDLVQYVEPLIGLDGAVPAKGIYHLANSGVCSWRDWGRFCIEAAAARGLDLKATDISPNRMEDVKAFVAKRPVNSAMDTSKFTRFTGITPRSWKEAMNEHFDNSPLFAAATRAR